MYSVLIILIQKPGFLQRNETVTPEHWQSHLAIGPQGKDTEIIWVLLLGCGPTAAARGLERDCGSRVDSTLDGEESSSAISMADPICSTLWDAAKHQNTMACNRGARGADRGQPNSECAL
jgi:hypothetical protein